MGEAQTPPDRISVYPEANDHFNPARPDWSCGNWDTDEVTGSYGREYIRADLATPYLPKGVGELVERIIENCRDAAWVMKVPDIFRTGQSVLTEAADTLEALAADNADKDAEIARLREGLGLIETEISSEETYNPNIAKIVRIALQEHEE